MAPVGAGTTGSQCIHLLLQCQELKRRGLCRQRLSRSFRRRIARSHAGAVVFRRGSGCAPLRGLLGGSGLRELAAQLRNGAASRSRRGRPGCRRAGVGSAWRRAGVRWLGFGRRWRRRVCARCAGVAVGPGRGIVGAMASQETVRHTSYPSHSTPPSNAPGLSPARRGLHSTLRRQRRPHVGQAACVGRASTRSAPAALCAGWGASGSRTGRCAAGWGRGTDRAMPMVGRKRGSPAQHGAYAGSAWRVSAAT